MLKVTSPHYQTKINPRNWAVSHDEKKREYFGE